MTRTHKWLAATAGVLALVLIASWMLLISPQRAHKADLNSQADDAQQRVASLQVQIRTLKSKADDVVAQEARIAAIGKELPDTPALSSYVLLLTAAAKKSGIDLQSIAPGPQTAVQLAAGAQAAAPAVKPSASPNAAADQASPSAPAAPQANPVASLSTIPIQLQVAGDYFQIRQFLAELEGLSRTTAVTALNLAPGGTRTGADKSTVDPTVTWKTLTGSISLNIFMTNGPLAGAPTPAPSPSPSL